MADEQLVHIALKNLVSNCVKFASARKTAKNEFGVTEINGKEGYFVKDNGIGFNMKSKDKLFIPFQRLHNDNKYSGSGIGLSIVQRIISRHNGRVWAESEINKGTTFHFTLENHEMNDEESF
ncbi:MAG: sensor histidine kinase [Candidatus Hodarchaeales archaeon]